MSTAEYSAIIGFLPIIYFLLMVLLSNRKVRTKALGLQGILIKRGETHSFVILDDGTENWFHNSFIEGDG